jgi:hypothetical protein
VRRYLSGLLLIGLFALIPAMMTAQDTPATTEEPPPAALPEGLVPIPTAVGAPADAGIPTQAPAPVSAIDPVAIPILINARTDMELLANQEIGAERPVGWSGSVDITNAQLPLLLRLDLELLAGRLLGAEVRPPGWFGAVAGPVIMIARDVRHDLELLADTVDVPNVRPPGWTGDDPLMRCDRGVQALVNMLERGGQFSLNVGSFDFNFCQIAELQASQFAEQNILNSGSSGAANNPGVAGAAPESAPLPGSVQVTSNLAVAFLNRFATEQVGIIPQGTNVQPIARSFTEFSRMILVRGQDFEVFIDYHETTLTDQQFDGLPNVDGVTVTPSCVASWCTQIVQTNGNPASGRGNG